VSAHDPKRLQALVEAAAPDLDLSFRPMFGGIMGYAGGAALLSLSNVGLAIKVRGADWDKLLAVEGALPLRYEPDSPPSKSYVVVPASVLDEAPALHDWLTRAARGLAPKPKKSRQA